MVFNNLIFYCKSAFVLCSGSQQGSAVTSCSTYPKYLLDLNFFYFHCAENWQYYLGIHIALPQTNTTNVSIYWLGKGGTKKSNEIADLVSKHSTLRYPVFAYCKVGVTMQIQVKFQPLVTTLPREGEFRPGTWAWVLSVNFPTSERCPTGVSRNSVWFLSHRYKFYHLTPQAVQGFLVAGTL